MLTYCASSRSSDSFEAMDNSLLSCADRQAAQQFSEGRSARVIAGCARRGSLGKFQDAGLMQGEGGIVAGALEVGVFCGPWVVVLERVDPDHRIAVGQKPLGEVRAYEAGTSCDKDSLSHCPSVSHGARTRVLGRPCHASWAASCLGRQTRASD